MDVQYLPIYLWEQARGADFDVNNSNDFHTILPYARAMNLVFWWLLLLYGMLVGRMYGGAWAGRFAVPLHRHRAEPARPRQPGDHRHRDLGADPGVRLPLRPRPRRRPVAALGPARPAVRAGPDGEGLGPDVRAAPDDRPRSPPVVRGRGLFAGRRAAGESGTSGPGSSRSSATSIKVFVHRVGVPVALLRDRLEAATVVREGGGQAPRRPPVEGGDDLPGRATCRSSRTPARPWPTRSSTTSAATRAS